MSNFALHSLSDHEKNLITRLFIDYKIDGLTTHSQQFIFFGIHQNGGI